MKILFVLKQKKNVETFAGTIRLLTERGHSVALAVQEHSDTRADQFRDWIEPATPKPGEGGPRFSLVRCPAHRTDRWTDVAWLRDCVHYQQPAMRNASRLQERSVQKLREELRIEADNERVAKAMRGLPDAQVARLDEDYRRRDNERLKAQSAAGDLHAGVERSFGEDRALSDESGEPEKARG